MTEDKISELFARVKKMWALAEHPNTPAEEADAARRAADTLIARYSIDEAVLRSFDQDEGRRESLVQKRLYVTGPWADSKVSLVWYLQDVFGVRCVYAKHLSGDATVHIVGFENAVASFIEAWNLLDPQRASALARARKAGENFVTVRPTLYNEETQRYYYGEPVRTNRQDRRFNRSFILGWNSRVGQRMAAARKAVVDEVAPPGSSTALALRDERQRVEDEFRSLHPNTRTTRGAGPSGAGVVSGRNHGDRATLGGTSLSGGQRALSR